MHIPNLSEAKKYIERVNNREKDIVQKNILYDLFSKHYPENNSIEQIFLKCTILNVFYLTNIFDTYSVAEHIIGVRDIDIRLKEADLSLIDEIANVRFKNITRKLYSFATKYCHFHQPNFYPIYDKNVDEALWYFSKMGYIKQVFKRNDLRDYRTFKEIINNFRDINKLDSLKYIELDKYLWLFGKELNKKLPYETV